MSDYIKTKRKKSGSCDTKPTAATFKKKIIERSLSRLPVFFFVE